MLISMIFSYVAGVIFIYSRVEPSVYIIFRVCCREMTSLISAAGIFCRLQVAGCGLKFNYNWKTAGT